MSRSYVLQTPPRVSVIIPTYNGLELLKQCLSALDDTEVSEMGAELIVVDNGSADGTELWLRRERPDVRCVRSEKNLGFGRACNLGIRSAQGEYLILLNNDTRPHPCWLRALTRRADTTSAGAIAAKLVYPGNPRVINNVGSLLIPSDDWPVKDRGIDEPDRGQYDNAPQPTAFCGAAVLLKRRMLEEIGLFDEHFFMYWEDGDMSWRAAKAGWRIDFEPEAVVEHLHAASSGDRSDFFRYHVCRNRVLILAKHASLPIVARGAAKAAGVFLVSAAKHLSRRHFQAASRELILLGRMAASLSLCLPWVFAVRTGLRREPRLGYTNSTTTNTPTLVAKETGPRRLRVGIYNPYLGTMGGGERMTVAMAEALSQTCEVELLARRMHGLPTVETLEEYFGVKLPGVSIIDLDAATAEGIQRLTRRPWARAAIRRVADVRDHWLVRTRAYDLFINNQFWSRMPCPTPLGIYLCMFPPPPRSRAVRGWQGFRRAALYATTIAERLALPDAGEAMASYSTVIAISEFTRRWLINWWAIGSQVVYPPCQNCALNKAGTSKDMRDKVILTVGRFFAPAPDNHNKRHDILIDAFALLSRIVPGYELHLVGSCAPDDATQKYVESLRNRAHGLSVRFHLNADREMLLDLYNRARLYWHATGYGSVPDSQPECEEHFGITTVEAMSAGAVPIVVPSGGQPEIVRDGINGYHWRDVRELVERSIQLIEDEKSWRTMSLRAQSSATAFNPSHFRQAFLQQIQTLFLQHGEVGTSLKTPFPTEN